MISRGEVRLPVKRTPVFTCWNGSDLGGRRRWWAGFCSVGRGIRIARSSGDRRGPFANNPRRRNQTSRYGHRSAHPCCSGSDPHLGPEAGAPRSGVFPVRMSAVLKGISNYDAVGPGKTLAGDDKPDGLFVLSIQAQDKEITAIEIRNTDGVQSIWDTVPGSNHGAIGVATVEDPVRLLNRKDGSVVIKIKDRADLNLYVADNGTIEGGQNAIIRFRSRSVTEAYRGPLCKRQLNRLPERSSEPAGVITKVNFLGTFMGFASTDAVGRYSGLKPDGVADAVFGLDIEVSPKSFITGIEIGNIDGTGRKWSTTGAPDSWGLAVAYQTAPTAILNKTDGSVRIPIDGRAQFYLYVADPGDISTTHQRMRIIVHLADGMSYQQIVRRAACHNGHGRARNG